MTPVYRYSVWLAIEDRSGPVAKLSLFAHVLFRKTGSHFSGTCGSLSRIMSLISGAIRAELERAYGAPDRHYHGLAHIEALLGLARQHAQSLSDPDVVEAAIWFHDAVYDTHRHDNEAKSAELAAARLRGATDDDRLARIDLMIRATAGHQLPSLATAEAVQDCALFLDMDLSILGAAPDAFAAYEAAVRREYAWVPEPMWIAGRRKVLEGFLARDAIYASPPFRASHEAAARRNLAQSLAALA
jgi:predicted metal-dependent HD superfamily phosphohydrolase